MEIMEHINAEERRCEVCREHDTCDVEHEFYEVAFPEPSQEHEECEVVSWFFGSRKILHP